MVFFSFRHQIVWFYLKTQSFNVLMFPNMLNFIEKISKFKTILTRVQIDYVIIVSIERFLAMHPTHISIGSDNLLMWPIFTASRKSRVNFRKSPLRWWHWLWTLCLWTMQPTSPQRRRLFLCKTGVIIGRVDSGTRVGGDLCRAAAKVHTYSTALLLRTHLYTHYTWLHTTHICHTHTL